MGSGTAEPLGVGGWVKESLDAATREEQYGQIEQTDEALLVGFATLKGVNSAAESQ